jgi:hypothetical protein
VGSQSKIKLAYIAGFLDGDGSLMLQIKRRKDGRLKRRFMLTICFYQDSRHEKPLYWIRDVLGIGYISKRNDGMTELRINGYDRVHEILAMLLPYLRFKKKQAMAMKQAADLLTQNGRDVLSESNLRKLATYVDIVQRANYVTKRKKTKSDLLKILGLTP